MSFGSFQNKDKYLFNVIQEKQKQKTAAGFGGVSYIQVVLHSSGTIQVF